MVKFSEMDSNVTLLQQMEEEISPIVLINRFTVAPEEVDQLLEVWEVMPHFLRRNRAIFPRNFIVALSAVVVSSTSQCGSQLRTSNGRLCSQHFKVIWSVTHQAPSRRRICSPKSLSPIFVWPAEVRAL
jgi:hypothetical protein